MFLALREIRHSKTRFIAIAGVVALLSYLVYFLTGLSYGLASSYTEVIRSWNAQSITMTHQANKNILASRMDENELTTSADSQPFSMTTVAIASHKPDATEDDRLDVYLMGVDTASWLFPDVVDGEKPSGNEVVVDDQLSHEGYSIGDTVSIEGLDKPLTISGFSTKTRFQTAPLLFVSPDIFYQATDAPKGLHLVNGVVNKSDSVPTISGDTRLETISIDDFIMQLPGYSAQIMTFGLMIGSLIVILSMVLGIFMYVLTIQKKNIFGIMKARGISTRYIAWSGAQQTLVISMSGVAIGLIGALATGLSLAPKVPFAVDPLFFVGVSLAFIFFTLVGSLFPIGVISKIDPIKAIG